MHSKLNQAATLFLIVLYAALGVTGHSAHYLLELVTSANHLTAEEPIQTSVAKAHGYFHCHGPDHHVHFHPTPHSSTPTTRVTSSDKKDSEKSRFAGPESYHLDHACPLLSVLRILEQGLGGHVYHCSQLELASTLSQTEQTRFADIEVSLHLARGPPQATLA